MNTEVNHLSKGNPTQKSSWLVVSWVLGIFLVLGSISMLFSHFVAGIALLTASLLILPISYEYIKHKYNFLASRGVRVGTILVLMAISGTFLPKPAPVQQTPKSEIVEVKKEPKVATEKVNTLSAIEAQKELDDLMSKAKSAGLVTSYDFTKLDKDVYRWDIFVGKVWYSQPVTFKKDFVAKIGTLKQAITGYSHFELRDGYSNEKVAELTAFSRSIEIYK